MDIRTPPQTNPKKDRTRFQPVPRLLKTFPPSGCWPNRHQKRTPKTEIVSSPCAHSRVCEVTRPDVHRLSTADGTHNGIPYPYLRIHPIPALVLPEARHHNHWHCIPFPYIIFPFVFFKPQHSFYALLISTHLHTHTFLAPVDPYYPFVSLACSCSHWAIGSSSGNGYHIVRKALQLHSYELDSNFVAISFDIISIPDCKVHVGR
jgi:hypothetical protein